MNFIKTAKNLIIKLTGKNYVVPTDDPNVPEILELIKNGATEEEVADVVDVRRMISKSCGDVTFEVDELNGTIHIDGDVIPNSLGRRLLEYSEASLGERALALSNFWKRIKLNPDPVAREDAFLFLEHNGLSITTEGYVLAFKGCNKLPDGRYLDSHSQTMNNAPGQVLRLDRSLCDSDPYTTCSRGIHAATQSYASGIGNCTMSVKIDPQFIVAIPKDHSNMKMRACEMLVLEEIPRDYMHTQSIIRKEDEFVFSYDAAAFTEY